MSDHFSPVLLTRVIPYFVTTWYCPYFFNLNLIFTVSLYFSLPNFTSSCLQDAKSFKHSPIYIQYLHVGFPGGSVVKNCLPMRGTSSIPRSGRYPGEGNGNPLQYSCLGNPKNRQAWRSIVHGVAKELDTT